jgi:hypothetical protein
LEFAGTLLCALRQFLGKLAPMHKSFDFNPLATRPKPA